MEEIKSLGNFLSENNVEIKLSSEQYETLAHNLRLLESFSEPHIVVRKDIYHNRMGDIDESTQSWIVKSSDMAEEHIDILRRIDSKESEVRIQESKIRDLNEENRRLRSELSSIKGRKLFNW